MGFPNEQSNPAGAIPVYVTAGGAGGTTFSNLSLELIVDVPVTIAPAQPTRKYLFIQPITPLVGVWVNWNNAVAEPEVSSTFYIAPGETYESGAFVPNGAISIVSTDDSVVTITIGV